MWSSVPDKSLWVRVREEVVKRGTVMGCVVNHCLGLEADGAFCEKPGEGSLTDPNPLWEL